MKETDHQTQIKLSVLKQGGYAFKLSNQFTIGIPDLLIMLPPFVPCIAEVKTLGECVEDFDRKLDLSPKQKLEISKMNSVYAAAIPAIQPRVAFILVHLVWQKQHRLIPLPGGTERLTGHMVAGLGELGKRQRGSDGAPPWYEMRPLLNHLNIPLI